MTFRRSARSLLLALGLALAPQTAPAHTADPLATPLWTNGVHGAAALDSIPARLNRYQLVALARVPSPATVGAIFDELGSYNPAVYRIGHWEPTRTGTDKYVEANNNTVLTSGLGYWLITRDSVTVRYDGTSVPADTVELPLFQGPTGGAEWNQLGNPFTFNTAVVNWRVVKRDSLLSLGQASAQNWMDANMRVYNPSLKQYTAAGTIVRGAGFFARLVDRDTALQWTRWTAEAGSGVGYFSSVKLDSKGNPHIVYFVDFSGDLRYVTRRNNSWTTPALILDTNTDQWNGLWASIDLDSLDNPYVAYTTGYANDRPFFIRRQNNGAWTIPEQIDAGPDNGWMTKIQLFHGVPRVAYVNIATQTLHYAEKTISGWNIETASAISGGVGSVVDSDIGFVVNAVNGRPHIVSMSSGSPRSLRYTTKIGNAWVSERVDTLAGGDTGLTPSIALDAAGNPHISYFDAQNVDLKYARRVGNSWVTETVDATGNTGNFGEIQIRPDGTPVIAFLEYTSMGVPNRIRLAQRVGSNWQIETVDDNGVSSFAAYLGLTLDSQGNPRVTYQATGPSLRYAEKIRGSWRIKIPPVASAPGEVAVQPEGAEWFLTVTARQEGRASEPVILGAASRDRVDALRSAKAPAPPDAGMLSLSVPRGGEENVWDFQAGAGTLRWTLASAGGVTPGEQTLEFAGFDLPPGLRFFLSDPEGGWTREVRPGESVTLAARPRTLELVATTGAAPATALGGDALAFAYPNPFARTTGLAFTLARRGDLRVDLYDVSGRRVRTLERAGAAAGEHVLTWDGRDESGRLVPSGVYLAAWKAGEAAGSRRLVKVD